MGFRFHTSLQLTQIPEMVFLKQTKTQRHTWRNLSSESFQFFQFPPSKTLRTKSDPRGLTPLLFQPLPPSPFCVDGLMQTLCWHDLPNNLTRIMLLWVPLLSDHWCQGELSRVQSGNSWGWCAECELWRVADDKNWEDKLLSISPHLVPQYCLRGFCGFSVDSWD